MALAERDASVELEPGVKRKGRTPTVESFDNVGGYALGHGYFHASNGINNKGVGQRQRTLSSPVNRDSHTHAILMVSPDSRLRTWVFIWCLRCFESSSLFASDLGSVGRCTGAFWAC
jgi:hypothetical protein